MPYTPSTWVDGPGGNTPITAAQLTRLETQYAQALADAAVSSTNYTNLTAVPKSRYFHVSDFGAIGNGVADDTAAIDAARAAVVAQGGGVLRFGPVGRTYLVSKVTVSSGITYLGEGATVRGTDGTVEGVFQAQGWVDSSTISDATVDGFLIDGGDLAKRGVFLIHAKYCRITNNRVFNIGTTDQSGIRLHWDTDSCWVENNHVTMDTDSPFGTLASSIGIYAVSNAPDSQGGGQNATLTFGTATSLSRGHTIKGNTVLNGTHGVSLFAAQDCVVIGNRVESQTHRGIIMSPIALRNTIVGNRIKEYGSTGIHMAWGSRWNVIADNNLSSTVSALEGNGIKGYYGCSDNQVTGNIIDGTLFGAIRFAMGCINNVIVGNRVNGAGTGVQLQSGLPAASGYYQPASVADITGTVISSNLLTACGKSVEFEASGTAGIRGVSLQGNVSDTPTSASYSITELTTSLVTGVSAVGNRSTGTTAHWALARGEQHFSQKTANTGLIATPTTGFMRSGLYYQCLPAFSVTTANTLGNGVFRCAPLRVPNSITLSKIGLEVTAAGDVGSTFRIGIYADNGADYPGVLVADLGTVAGDAIAVAELTVSTVLEPGTYWIGAALQGVTTTQPTVRSIGTTNGPGVEAIPFTTGATPAANGIVSLGYAMLSVTGALPATFSASLNLTGTIPRIFVKLA